MRIEFEMKTEVSLRVTENMNFINFWKYIMIRSTLTTYSSCGSSCIRFFLNESFH